ncbi:hypothetical protein JHK86_028289 [Glycine max]|nr:hypothetical protein JHK86_028289 [Glycine max]
MHTDGSARGCSGHRGAGGIFCDHSRGVLGCFSSYVGTQFMLYAEVVAVILALDIVKEKAWSHAWLESIQEQSALKTLQIKEGATSKDMNDITCPIGRLLE